VANIATKVSGWLGREPPKGLVGWAVVAGVPLAIILVVLGVITYVDGGTDPAASIAINHAGGEWDDRTHEGSHWGALLGWSTTGKVTSCTLGDNQRSAPQTVPASTNSPMRYGSYAGSITSVELHLHCDGPRDDDQRPRVNRPPGPLVKLRIARAVPDWLDAAHTHWQVIITFSSKNAVNCWISDNVSGGSFHKDPSGGTNQGYGTFSASADGVDLTLTCINVAGTRYAKAAHVRRP
jgi:hypothetical protein